jgi:hypothetical protein
MSMPIQRQSESFGYFDDGPRFARDRTSTDLPKGLAALINTSGPRIQGGLLNTRLAVNVDGMDPDSHAYHTERPVDGPGPGRIWNPDFRSYEPSEQDERDQEAVGEDDDSGYNWGPEPRRASRHPFDRTRTAGAWEDTFGEDTPNPFAGKDPDKFFTDWLERGTDDREDRREHKVGLARTAACESCGGDVYHISGEGFVHADTDDKNGWDIDDDHQAEPDHDDDLQLGLSSMNAEHERRELQGRRIVAEMASEPLPMPQDGGGYQIGHRVGLPWRNKVIPGTVIGAQGPNVNIIWDDGQKSIEEPHNIQLL